MLKEFLNLETKKEIQRIMDFKNISEDEAVAEILNLYAKKYANLVEGAQRGAHLSIDNYKEKSSFKYSEGKSLIDPQEFLIDEE